VTKFALYGVCAASRRHRAVFTGGTKARFLSMMFNANLHQRFINRFRI
jgi:hypothetical protein